MNPNPHLGSLQPPLCARNGVVLKVLAICRISTLNQDELSLNDQEAYYREWISTHSNLPFEMKVIAGRGSGENLEREEFLMAAELVNSREFDLVIAEDLARICRRIHAMIFCEECEDSDTRLIAINDRVDTGQEDWRLHSFFAVMHHETHNRDTSRRIRRSLRHRFTQGGVVQVPIFGYIKPVGCKSDADLMKDPDAEPIFKEWFRRLEMGEPYAAIADWLIELGVPPGPGARSGKWSGKLVKETTFNSILKGVRQRNRRKSKRTNKTGRYGTIKAPPEELLERECPHLAFFEPDYYDRIIRMLEENNAKYSRGKMEKKDPLCNRPKKRTRFPGQLIECGICGRPYVFGGHGQTDHLMCNGAREYRCWNGITVDGPLAAEKISQAVLLEFEELEGFDQELLQLLEVQADQKWKGFETESVRLASEIDRIDRELQNLLRFIREGVGSESIRAELLRLEQDKRRLLAQRDSLPARPNSSIAIPTAMELRQLAEEEFSGLALDSFEFASLMRQLIPKIVVFPFRDCLGGKLVLKSRFRLRLAELLPSRDRRNVFRDSFEKLLDVDLFNPCQRVEFREKIVALTSTVNPHSGKNYSIKDAAALLGITATAAQWSVKLQRKMEELGIDDPFLPVIEPPNDFSKLRRHLHARYRFDPLDQAGDV